MTPEDAEWAREIRDIRNDRFGDEFQHETAEHGKPQPVMLVNAAAQREFVGADGCRKICANCAGHGLVDIQSGPYERTCPVCSGSGRRDNAHPDRTADQGCSVDGAVDDKFRLNPDAPITKYIRDFKADGVSEATRAFYTEYHVNATAQRESVESDGCDLTPKKVG